MVVAGMALPSAPFTVAPESFSEISSLNSRSRFCGGALAAPSTGGSALTRLAWASAEAGAAGAQNEAGEGLHGVLRISLHMACGAASRNRNIPPGGMLQYPPGGHRQLG